jgi:hypothetical protein
METDVIFIVSSVVVVTVVVVMVMVMIPQLSQGPVL